MKKCLIALIIPTVPLFIEESGHGPKDIQHLFLHNLSGTIVIKHFIDIRVGSYYI